MLLRLMYQFQQFQHLAGGGAQKQVSYSLDTLHLPMLLAFERFLVLAVRILKILVMYQEMFISVSNVRGSLESLQESYTLDYTQCITIKPCRREIVLKSP